jgi:hypothetical protein
MVNRCERSINVATQNKPKMLTGLSQHGTVAGRGAELSPLVDTRAPPADRADLPHPVIDAEHGKPIVLPSG